MADTPMDSASGKAQQEVARLSELFRQSFAALDADARTAGQRWAGEINRELDRAGNVDIRANTRQALSDIQSLDRELGRNRAINVGADVDAAAGAAGAPLGGGGLRPMADAIGTASAAAAGLAGAVGGVVGAVGALGSSASQLRDSIRRLSVPTAASPPPLGSIPPLNSVGDSLDQGMSAAQPVSPGTGASSGSSALPALGSVADGLSKLGGAGVPGNVTVAPPSQAAGSPGIQGPADALGGGSIPQTQSAVPGMSAPPMADMTTGSMPPGAAEMSPPAGAQQMPGGGGSDALAPGLLDSLRSLTNLGGLGGGLSPGGLGSPMPGLSLPSMPAGLGDGLGTSGGLANSNPLGTATATAANGGPQLPGANQLGGQNDNYYAPGMAPGASGGGTGGGAGGQRGDAGVLNLPGGGADGRGMNPAGGIGGGAGTLTSGRISMGNDPMGNAPTGSADASSLGSQNDMGKTVAAALFPGMGGGTTNNQNATFNINGGGKDPGMDLFMSFWREFGRWGGLAGAVGSLIQ